ncbi:hypothetical protein [Mesorhizobium mediterraneum]|uniref:Uncharacterized protein n=1 Tax=Mesorhizobium mediterraneum TaxID=43617 RepID=A0AB36R165_9HYPH|nr:hypothetical protein [Mesorhizobium mediterraneum]PAP98311.1 hypothetical protein CIT25_31690 [Mesorhizobium mediterraneum]RWN43585.1 MAG: hypothetical protein EOR96_05810 [Mesorhizobium sp.]RWQ67508.1 MAG: hypothetical protein EOS86_05380 [Mesorhizobium sp.]
MEQNRKNFGLPEQSSSLFGQINQPGVESRPLGQAAIYWKGRSTSPRCAWAAKQPVWIISAGVVANVGSDAFVALPMSTEALP